MSSIGRRIIQHPSGGPGLVILLVLLVGGAVAGLFYPAGPMAMDADALVRPFQEIGHPFGTDSLGRDVLSGLLYGSRVSIKVGVISTVLSVATGILIGAFAGYYGGFIDDILMRTTEAFQTMPSFLLAMAFVSLAGASITSIIISIALVSWPMVARLVRAEFLHLRSESYVQACKVIGMSDLRIIFGQMIPNCFAPVVVAASVLMATSIKLEAALSFLGFGDANALSWGMMIGEARSSIRSSGYATLFPAAAIVLAVLSMSLLGNALNDVLNPRRNVR